MTVAHLLEGLVALLHLLFESLLLEGDLTGLLKVLFTNFLLSRLKLRDIGVVALLHILMCALKDGILLEGGDGLILLNTTESSLGIVDAAAEVNSTVYGTVILTSLTLVEVQPVGVGNSQESKKGNKNLGRSKMGKGLLYQLSLIHI